MVRNRKEKLKWNTGFKEYRGGEENSIWIFVWTVTIKDS